MSIGPWLKDHTAHLDRVDRALLTAAHHNKAAAEFHVRQAAASAQSSGVGGRSVGGYGGSPEYPSPSPGGRMMQAGNVHRARVVPT
jgi:hypothetical protein